MASKREMEALLILSGKISPTLQNTLRQANKGINGIGSSSNLMSKTLNKGFDLAAKAAAIGTAAVGAGLAYIGIKGVKLASDLTEVQNVVDTTFGANSKSVDAWSQTALDSFGLSELSAKQYSSTLGAMLKSSGLSAASTLTMSENLTALSGDMASFNNLDPAKAFEKIRSGISGETEPLKEIGINMSVANLEAYAMSKGIKASYSQMDQASQTALRYNYLLSVTKDTQGDFAKTAGSLANQVRVAQTSFDELSAKIMKAAIPSLTKLVQYGNSLLKGAMGNPQFIKTFQDILTSGMDKIIELVPKAISWFEQLGPKIAMLYDIAKNVFNFIYNNWPLIEPIIWGLVIAQLAFNGAAKAALIIEAVTKAIGFAQAAMIFYRDGASLATIAQWALNGAMSANIIGLVILALAALGVAIYEVVKHWQDICEWVGKAWDALTKWNGSKANDKNLNVNTSYTSTNTGLGPNKSTAASIAPSETYVSAYLKKYASGGFASQPAIFGEAGPEAAIPLKYKSPRSLSILSQTAKAIGADSNNGSGQIQLIYSPTITGGNSSDIDAKLKAQADEFKAWLEDYFAEKGRVSFG